MGIHHPDAVDVIRNSKKGMVEIKPNFLHHGTTCFTSYQNHPLPKPKKRVMTDVSLRFMFIQKKS